MVSSCRLAGRSRAGHHRHRPGFHTVCCLSGSSTLERTRCSDIDIDFDDRRRGEMVRYAAGEYFTVAQVITFGNHQKPKWRRSRSRRQPLRQARSPTGSPRCRRRSWPRFCCLGSLIPATNPRRGRRVRRPDRNQTRRNYLPDRTRVEAPLICNGARFKWWSVSSEPLTGYPAVEAAAGRPLAHEKRNQDSLCLVVTA